MELTLEEALQKGIAAHKAGQVQEAHRLYTAILQTQPKHPGANHNMGVLAVGFGKVQEALPFFKTALEANPSIGQYWLSYIGALIKLDRMADAQSMFDQAKNKGVKGEAFDQLEQRLNAAQSDLIKVSKSQGPSQDQLQPLINLYSQGQLQQALEKAKKLLKQFPNSVTLYNIQGAANAGLKQFDAAIDSYKQALKIKPDYAETYNNMGVALRNKGELEAAIDSYKQALKIKPDYADAYNNMGVALKDKGELEAAIDSYKQALKIKPDYAEAHYNLYPLLLDPDDMTPSIKCMKRAVGIKPSRVDFSFFLGMLLDYSGKPQEAKPYFDTVKNGAAGNRAKLDAWHYIKSAKDNVPTMIGSSIQAFKLGIDAAVNNGLVLEFGVRFGTSIRQIAALVDQDVHGFDSFQGLPEPWHDNPKGSYSTKGVIPPVPEHVTLHEGWFEETLPGFVKKHPEPVRFMNIDCDIYSSTETVLKLLAKQIIPGTVIVFDEYIGNEHWREDEFKAFQEAVLKHGWEYEYLCFSFMTKQVVVRIN